MKKLVKKWTAVMLTAVLIVTLFPGIGLVSRAEIKQVKTSDPKEIRNLLQSDENVMVILTGDAVCEYESLPRDNGKNGSVFINVGKGEKVLDLNGHEMKCLVKYYDGYLGASGKLYMFEIGKDAKLVVEDNAGRNEGRLNFDAWMYAATEMAGFASLPNYRNYSVNHRNYFHVTGGEFIMAGGELVTRSKEQWMTDGCNVKNYYYDTTIGRFHRFDGKVWQNTNTVAVTVESGTVVIDDGIIAARGYREMETDANGTSESAHTSDYRRAACILQWGGEVIVNDGQFEAYGGADCIQAYGGSMKIKAGWFHNHDLSRVLIPTPDVPGSSGHMPLYMDGSYGQFGVPLEALDQASTRIWNPTSRLSYKGRMRDIRDEGADVANGRILAASEWTKANITNNKKNHVMRITGGRKVPVALYDKQYPSGELGPEITEIEWDLSGNPLYFTPAPAHWEEGFSANQKIYYGELSLSDQVSVSAGVSIGGQKVADAGENVNEIRRVTLANWQGVDYFVDKGGNLNNVTPVQARFYLKDIIPEDAKAGDSYLLTYSIYELFLAGTIYQSKVEYRVRVPVRIVDTGLLKGDGIIDEAGAAGKKLAVSGDVYNYPSGVLKYQWQRTSGGSWVDISGATESTYTLTQADHDSHVRAVITAADRSGTIITNDCVWTDGVEIAEKNFEDPVFRQYLSDKYDTDQNGILSDAEIEKIQEIRLDDARDNGKYKAVVSLQGASKLWNVTGVIASNTAISSFDGKNMDRLTVLHLENCPLDSLIVKDNKRLNTLNLAGAQGAVHDVDLYSNPALGFLSLQGSSVTSIDISSNPALVNMILFGTRTEKNGAVEYKGADGYSHITLPSSMEEKNIVIAWFDKNMTHLFKYLKNMESVNPDGDNRLTLEEANSVVDLDIYKTTYGVSGSKLAHLRGIEYFQNLESLVVKNAAITEADFSKNKKLKKLNLSGNKLGSEGGSGLDISQNASLEELKVSDNEITSLDLSGYPNLRVLAADNNRLTDLDISRNMNLESLTVIGNEIPALDLTGHAKLGGVRAYANEMGLIEMGGCSLLEKALAGKVTHPTDGNYGVEFDNYTYGKLIFAVDKDIAIVREVSLPKVTGQPESVVTTAGKTVTFNVSAKGAGLTYQWIVSTDNGSKWQVIKGETSDSLTVTVAENMNNYQYRCRVINAAGKVVSDAAVLSVSGTKPMILTQPVSQKVARAKKATFTVAVAGDNIRLQWYQSKDNGKTWTALAGETGTALTVKGSVANNGFLYRCKAANSKGKSLSAKAKLTVSGVKPAIRTQPVNKAVTAGKQVTFKIDATGVGMKYQWQYSKDGGKTWINNKGKGSNTNTFSFTTKKTQNGLKYRCVVTNTYGSRASNAVNLKVK